MTMFGIDWRYWVMALLLGSCLILTKTWQDEVKAHAQFRGEAKAAGKAAEEAAKQKDHENQDIVKGVSNAWHTQIPAVEKNAVARYIARYGNSARLCPGAAPVGLQPHGGSSLLSGAVEGPQGDGGGEQELVADRPACDPEFVRACAADALARRITREWALRHNLTVVD